MLSLIDMQDQYHPILGRNSTFIENAVPIYSLLKGNLDDVVKSIKADLISISDERNFLTQATVLLNCLLVWHEIGLMFLPKSFQLARRTFAMFVILQKQVQQICKSRGWTFPMYWTDFSGTAFDVDILLRCDKRHTSWYSKAVKE